MREREKLPEEKYSKFCAVTNQPTGYKIPSQTKEINDRGIGATRFAFNEPKPIDRNDRVSNYTIKTSMEAGIDPATRSVAPKVYGIDNNPEQLQRQVEAYTEQLDEKQVIAKYEQIKREQEEEKKKKAEANGTGSTTTI